MEKELKRMTTEEIKQITNPFLKMVGTFIKAKREKKGYTLEELSYLLNRKKSVMSMYESGNRDINISLLPIISTYCDFELKEYFQPETIDYVKTFKTLVSIEKRKIEKSSKQYIKNGKWKRTGIPDLL